MGINRNRPFVLVRPPNRPSASAQVIRNALGDDVARLSRIERIPKQYKYLLSWGNTEIAVPHSWGPNFKPGEQIYINKPGAIRKAVNKWESLNVWSSCGVRVPVFTSDPDSLGSADIYLARTVLTGSGGAGIVVLRRGDPIIPAPLYVQYIKKEKEYRVHVAFGEVIFVQQKKRVSDKEQTKDEKLIRNYDNGWVFCPLELDEIWPEIKDAAVNAVAGLGLDFGAIDLVVGLDDGLPYVLECNTAPGLSSPGLIEAYKNAFLTKLTR